ncbi:MAG: integration host factor subunit beta [Bacteroidaceae bacterium]|nr:integration host factor subunit beta [Bacteroidaceae bacterium]
MTKIELVRAIAQKTGIDQPTVLASVEAMIDTLMEQLIIKENVFIRGWGTWTLKHRATKTARNISKNTTIVIPAHDIPYFKPCKDFMEAVAKGK